MTDNPFMRPGEGKEDTEDRWDLKNEGPDMLGTLFIIYPKEVKEDFQSGDWKPTDVVVADIVAVDGPDQFKGRIWKNTFIFAKFIVGDTKNKVGKFVLGRLGRKQGKNGEGWNLMDFTDNDVALALPVHQRYIRGEFEQPGQTDSASPTPGGNTVSDGSSDIDAKLRNAGVPQERIASMDNATKQLLLANMGA